ncbi:hypothetical protein Cflav_PD0784 [Pedosphaera parvula Ellin514]|uniref:Uncharacterized protein n=1 Tax=Pedosphaera parvula (strain Ellin514) TaxID=320771 RepID=B9XR26_PEDPL|nr:hypothetical protein Cflav_PD0784 [Pedosphaera parvula Ellin514]
MELTPRGAAPPVLGWTLEGFKNLISDLLQTGQPNHHLLLNSDKRVIQLCLFPAFSLTKPIPYLP